MSHSGEERTAFANIVVPRNRMGAIVGSAFVSAFIEVYKYINICGKLVDEVVPLIKTIEFGRKCFC